MSERRGCVVVGCDRKHEAKGLCAMHYMRKRRSGEVGGVAPQRIDGRVGCVVVDCDQKHVANGWCKKHNKLAHRYNINPQEYENKKIAQGGCCAACGRDLVLQQDHNHKTSQVRGLLCKACNTTLGLVDDNANRLLALATYLVTYDHDI